MNDDAFEKKLRALTGASQRPDPTLAWKSDILARARREAAAGKRALPPRWLMTAWGVAWAAILVMNLATPDDPQPRNTQDFAATNSIFAPGAMLPDDAWSLLALHQRMNLNPESRR